METVVTAMIIPRLCSAGALARDPPKAGREFLKRVHVNQQILNLLLVQCLAKSGHLASAIANDFAHPLIVGRQAALRQVGLLEDAFEPRPLPSTGRVRFVALVAVPVVDAASRAFLRIESQFRIRLATLRVACPEKEKARRQPA